MVTKMSKEIVKIASEKTSQIQFRNTNLSKNSKARYNNIVKNYYSFLKEKGLAEGFESVRQWLNSIRNYNTFNISLQAIKEYLYKRFENESPERRLEVHEFFESVNRKKPKKEISESEYLTKAQVYELAEHTTDIVSCFIMALFQTGCRISEITNVKLSDCRANGFVYIKVHGKGAREREVSMTRKLYDRIIETFKGKKYLFETSEGKSYAREYITREISRQSKKMGYDKIGSHTFRHSKAMHLKEKGYSPDQIAKSLGHSSPLTTIQHYFHGSLSAEQQLEGLE